MAHQGAARAVQLDADHQTLAANLFHGTHAFELALERCLKIQAEAVGVFKQAVFFHDANGFNSGSHRQRVATEGGAVVARLKNIRGFGASDHRAYGDARAQAFGQWHHIRLNA